MSIDLTTCLGPYAACKVALVDTTERRRCCPDNECANYGVLNATAKFCPLCGSQIVETDFSSQRWAVRADEVQRAIQEVLYLIPGGSFHDLMRAGGVHLWLPNRIRPDDKRPWSWTPRDGIRQMEITPALMEAEVAEFREQYDDALATLGRFYGTKNVRVHWGLNHYIN